MSCTNPECYCQQESEFKTKPFISGKDRDAAFRSAISKLRNASNELGRMETEGQVDLASGNGDLQVMLDSIIYELTLKHREAAERFGFTMKSAIGVGDWKEPDAQPQALPGD